MERLLPSRTSAIAKVSSYLIWFTVAFICIVPILCLVAVLVIWIHAPAGDFTASQVVLQSIRTTDDFWQALGAHGVTFGARIILTLTALLIAATLEYVMVQLNQLLTCFRSGEIFNKNAVRHTRAAFHAAVFSNLFFYVVQTVTLIYSLMFFNAGHRSDFFMILANIVGDTVWVGVSLLIIWSLEIGAELNEEAQLTI